MASPSSRVPESNPSSSHKRQVSPVMKGNVETERPPRYVLPQNLDVAIRQLSDTELDSLATATLEEKARREHLVAPKDIPRKLNAKDGSVSLPQGKLSAVR